MVDIMRIPGLLICAVLLLACEAPDRHPIVGSFERNTENSFGPEISELEFDDDGRFAWTLTYVGLKEMMQQRNPDHDWEDISLEISGKYTISDDEIVMSPDKSIQRYGGYGFGEPIFPLFEDGQQYIYPYYFEGANLILINDAGDEIAFVRK